MFTMLALLMPDAPDVPLEALETTLRELFGRNPGFTLEYETLPFKKTPSIIVRWPGWWVRLFLETGQKAIDGARDIADILGDAAPVGLTQSDRRFRVVFYDDPGEDFINHMVEIMTMLEEIDGAVVFDPQQNDLMR